MHKEEGDMHQKKRNTYQFLKKERDPILQSVQNKRKRKLQSFPHFLSPLSTLNTNAWTT